MSQSTFVSTVEPRRKTVSIKQGPGQVDKKGGVRVAADAREKSASKKKLTATQKMANSFLSPHERRLASNRLIEGQFSVGSSSKAMAKNKALFLTSPKNPAKQDLSRSTIQKPSQTPF